MEYEEQGTDYSEIVDTIANMFGDVIAKDAIFAVVESCEGDLNVSVEAIMNITSDTCNSTAMQSEHPETNSVNQQTMESTIEQNGLQSTNISSTPEPQPPSMSYAAASQSTGAIPKQILKLKPIPNTTSLWTDQIREIVISHNHGTRTLIILRGAPGSGKSYLARQIIDMTIGSSDVNYNTHIFSTDDYFMIRGQYKFNKFELSEAHMWNQNRVQEATTLGLSPVIIDNTNIAQWEMEPYVRFGVNNGYFIRVVEPTTPWAKKLTQLARRNTHNVPIATIKRMLEIYHEGLTGEHLIKEYGLSYPNDMVPPVLRTTPVVIQDQCFENGREENAVGGIVNSAPFNSNTSNNHHEEIVLNQNRENFETSTDGTELVNETKENTLISVGVDKDINSGFNDKQFCASDPEELTQEELLKHELFMEAQKRLEEMEKVELEWDNGESWDDECQGTVKNNNDNSSVNSKPPRKKNEAVSSEKIMDSVNKCEDWSKIYMFMPPWNDSTISETSDTSHLPVEMKSSSTCMERDDTHNNNIKNHKIISASPRNINEYNVSFNNEKIPNRRMLDKSSMTNDHLITEAYRCKNEEKHFNAFRKLFKNVAKADLRDVFDKCHGDVNWAVDIVIDSVASKLLDTVNNECVSDVDEENSEECTCAAFYNIIPDTKSNTIKPAIYEDNASGASSEIITQTLKKPKKDSNSSEYMMQLKRQIETNVVFPDKHYSQHCLKIRQMRRGEHFKSEVTLEQPSTSANVDTELAVNSSDTAHNVEHSDEESNASVEDFEKVVNVNLGMEFVMQLDELFGRKDTVYPDSIVPKITIPLSSLNEINALWMESMTYQVEQQAKQSEIMVKQDEEFARQLAMKEAELMRAGEEPAVPDFKEIMDMDFAVALYQKDVAEWRNNEPMDLAAKLSRDKLYNLFPSVSQDVLSELLMAHENNFQSTVEVLLMSTGRADVLEVENGVNKFVMEKELERQEKMLEEERKNLAEVEWPLLPKGEKVEMSTVNRYREEADKHLRYRNLYYQKAQDSIGRGMTQVATYYSGIASFHKDKYEQANSLAAASLMQVHASKNPDTATVDLHYLRVSEAKETLDLFLDTHIQKLRESQPKGPKCHTLFFITGRGLHSPGGPRVKPAVKRRLRERGLTFRECNPGLLTSKVCADDKMSYQVQVP